MRLEIVIPDSTPLELKAKLAILTQQLSARPELADAIRVSKGGEDAAIQAMFTPELIAEIEAAGADMKAGNSATFEDLDAALSATKTRWLAGNPS